MNGTCLNTAGYFECVCKDGYFGDGHICTGWLQKLKVAVTVEVSIGKKMRTRVIITRNTLTVINCS